MDYFFYDLSTGEVTQVGQTSPEVFEVMVYAGRQKVAGVAKVGQRYIDGVLVDVVPVVTREHIAAKIADTRWQYETGGTIWQGKPVNTERDAVALLKMAVDDGRSSGIWPPEWKLDDGVFYPLSAGDYESLRVAVRVHIQAAFAWEATELQRLASVADADLSHFTMAQFGAVL
ncbi:DUF4376 domain-containing protein [Deefgea sp. CFH1-16]|uniref:DUF4376 domain-containing protein n=1 Tax=Deefgea sp. CFH1-16 TaxID=2675457 RepID=UPI0015F4035E|nr:DUF4376 domain-containing protein [Deefgea sp. CFH1-16]MBM5575834.1 DUF4376 domain-containing protein [Deefgea sp. CFH1-16]